MERVRVLDGLRAVAIIIVMLNHSGLKRIIPGGFGVTVFFFLSGYLITTLLVREAAATGTINFRLFYLKRTVRIIPPMLIAIAFALALSFIGIVDPVNLKGLPFDLLFLTNYALPASRIPIPLWSLDVEEHFYLVFPLVFLVCLRRFPAAITLVVVLGLIVTLCLRFFSFELGLEDRIYYWSHTRIDSILFGCLLGVFNNPRLEQRVWIGSGVAFLVIGCGLILFTFVFRDPVFRETWRYSFQGVGLFFIFNYALRTDGIFSRALSIQPLKLIGDYSYALYLFHYPLLVTADRLLPGVHSFLQNTAGIATAFAAAAAMRHFVELPLLKWRKGFEKKWSRQTAPAEAHSAGRDAD